MSKLWGIRHIRWYIMTVRFNLWWVRIGRHLGEFPNPADMAYLDAVWRGEA